MRNLSTDLLKPLMIDKLRLPNNEICRKCDAQLKSPLVPWLVGSSFHDSKERVLFIGKPHRVESNETIDGQVLETSSSSLAELMSSSWAYWNYTREIAALVYPGQNPWDYIAFSNAVKCTNVVNSKNSTDTTSYLMARSCVSELQVVQNEIITLEPRTIIFYTFSLFRELLIDLPAQLGSLSCVSYTDIDHRVKCGAKKLGWWYRGMTTPWCEHLKVLVTGHPERMNKRDYIRLVSNWITEN